MAAHVETKVYGPLMWTDKDWFPTLRTEVSAFLFPDEYATAAHVIAISQLANFPVRELEVVSIHCFSLYFLRINGGHAGLCQPPRGV